MFIEFCKLEWDMKVQNVIGRPREYPDDPQVLRALYRLHNREAAIFLRLARKAEERQAKNGAVRDCSPPAAPVTP